jgi:formylglycine-generating enzyme
MATFDGKWIDWPSDPKAEHYVVNINGEEYVSPFNFYQVPEEIRQSVEGFVAQVKTVSNDPMYHDSVYGNTLTKLPALKEFTFEYGVLSWEEVTGAVSYDVKINSTVFSVSDNFYDLRDLARGEYQILVRANGVENLMSTFSGEYQTEYSLVKESEAINLRVQDYTLEWDEIEGAQTYKVNRNQLGFVEVEDSFYDLSSEPSGDISIQVYTRVGDQLYLSTIDVNKLEDIKNFTIENNSLAWSAVEYASGYMVYVNGTGYDVSNTRTYHLDEQFDGGAYTIEVRAYSNQDNHVYSSYSNSILTNKLSDRTTIEIISGTLHWSSIEHAVGYRVTFGTETYEVTDTNVHVEHLHGTHDVHIQAIGDGVAYVDGNETEGYAATRLQTPVLTYSEGSVLWQTIDNAQGYRIYLDDEAIDLGSDTTFDLPITDDDYTVVVEALGGNAYLSSRTTYEPTEKPVQLDLWIDGDGVSWTETDIMTDLILILNDERLYLTGDQSFLSFDDIRPSGSYTLRLVAIEETETYLHAISTGTVTFEKLEAVQNIRNDNGYLVWDGVDHASGYEVQIGESVYVTEESAFDGASIIESGTYDIHVRATEGTDFIDANRTDGGSFVILDIIDGLDSDDNRLEWETISNASGYLIRINDGEIETETPAFEFDDSYGAGTYAVSIRALGNETYLASGYSQPVTYEKLEVPLELRLEDGLIMIGDVMNADGYRLEINGVTYDYDTDTAFLMPQEVTESLLSIRVMALGNQTAYLDSDYTESIVFRKLATPDVYIEDGLIKWTNTTHAVTTSYHLFINDVFYDVELDMSFPFSLDDLIAGKNEIKVRANGSNERVSSVLGVLETEKLAPVTNVQITGNTISFDAVSNATGYRLHIGDMTYTSETNAFDLGEVTIDASSYIVAYGDDAIESEKFFIVLSNMLPDLISVGEKATAYTIPTGTSDGGTATVEGGYLMATTETTYELWYEVRVWAESNGYHFDNLGREGNDGTTGVTPTEANKHKPVTYVSWRDVIVWTNALSEMTGREPVYRTAEGVIIKDSRDSNASQVDSAIQTGNNGYRLPTSMEWEMAARWRNSSGEGSILVGGRYWTPGDYASGATAYYNNTSATRAVAWYSGASGGNFTRPVGQLLANHLGLYDMSGNVWEWTFTPSGSYRVIRGGGYYHSAINTLVGYVNYLNPGSASDNRGFRMILGQ